MASVILRADSFVCSSNRVAVLDSTVLGADFFDGYLTTDLATAFFGGTRLPVVFFFAGRFLAVEVLTDFLAFVFKDFFTGFFLFAAVVFVD